MKKITLILLFILVLGVLTSCEEDVSKEMVVLRDVKKNFDNSLDLSNWECFQCYGIDKDNYEFFFIRELNENCAEKLFVTSENGSKTYESCRITLLDSTSHFISIVNTNDTLFEFYSEKNVFPLHILRPITRVEIVKGRSFLDSYFGLSDPFYGKKEEYIKTMPNGEKRIIIDILEH